jgi:O-antigen ligase
LKDKVLDFLKDCFGDSRINILFFTGVLILLIWMPVEYGARYINTQVAGQVICGGLILILIREKNETFFKYPLWAISFFWIAVLCFSFAFSIARLASLEELMRNILYISLPLIIFSWATSDNRIKLLSYTVLLTGTLVSSIAIFGFLSDYIKTLIFTPASSPLSRTNDLGAYMLLIFPLAISSFLYEDKSPIEKVLYALASILSFITIILTFSRGIWLSIIIAIILVLILGRKILKKNLIYIGIVAVLSAIPIIIKWESIVNRLLSLQNIFLNAENSIEWRKSLLRGSLKIFEDHPVFGTGLNTFGYIYSLYQERAGYFSINPHNYYLQLLTETGVIGFITFVVLALSILYMSFKAFANSENIFKGIALGLLVGIISSLIHISVDIDWSVTAIPILFWVEVGLLIAIYNRVNFKETRYTNFNDRFNYIKRPVMIIIAISLIIIPTLNFYSLTFYTKANKDFSENDIDNAESNIYWALKLSPWPSAKHHSLYASILLKENKLPEALNVIEKAIKLEKFNYNFYKTYAEIVTKISPRNREMALNALITAVTLNPYMHPKSYEDVGDYFLNEMKNENDAIYWYKNATKHFPLAQLGSYEPYTPDDRYQLYRICKKLGTILEKQSPKEAKEYKYISTFLLNNQRKVESKLGDSTATPTAVIKSYWQDYGKPGRDTNKYILEGSMIFQPPSDFTYEFVDFINIEHSIFSAKVEYKILIKSNLGGKEQVREYKLIDMVVPTDEKGWQISSRAKGL